MQVEFKDINATTREIAITVEPERVEKAYQKYLTKAAKDIEVPGFRKGKAPVSLMERLHGDKIKDYFEKDFIDEVFDEAASEHEIHFLLFPEVKEVKWERGQEMAITLEIEHEPAVEFKQTEGLEVPFKELSLDEEVTDFLQNLAKEHMTAQDMETAEDNDQLSVELSFDNSGQPYTKTVTMYAGDAYPMRSLPEFINAKTGDVIEKELTGAMIRLLTMDSELKLDHESLYPCKLLVNSILRLVEPALDDEFAKDMDHENLAEMRSKVADDLRLRNEHRNIEGQHNALFAKLYTDNPFPPPSKTLRYIVEQQLEQMDPKYREILGQYYFDHTLQDMVTLYISKALKQQHPIELTDELTEAYIEHRAILDQKNPAAWKEDRKAEIDSEDFKESAMTHHIMRKLAASSTFVEPPETPAEPETEPEEEKA